MMARTTGAALVGAWLGWSGAALAQDQAQAVDQVPAQDQAVDETAAQDQAEGVTTTEDEDALPLPPPEAPAWPAPASRDIAPGYVPTTPPPQAPVQAQAQCPACVCRCAGGEQAAAEEVPVTDVEVGAEAGNTQVVAPTAPPATGITGTTTVAGESFITPQAVRSGAVNIPAQGGAARIVNGPFVLTTLRHEPSGTLEIPELYVVGPDFPMARVVLPANNVRIPAGAALYVRPLDDGGRMVFSGYIP